MKNIALYGGSFDPPHIGHEAVVKALLDLKYIDEIIIMPTFLNPFKDGSTAPASLRLDWLEEIYSNYERVSVSSYEVDQNKKVPAIQSVKFLLQTYEKVYLVIGADNLEKLQSWYKFDELKKLVTFIVSQRDGIEISENFITLGVDEKISSSALRKKIDIAKLSKKMAKQIQQYYKEKNE